MLHTQCFPFRVADQQLSQKNTCQEPRELYEESQKAYAKGLPPGSGVRDTIDAVYGLVSLAVLRWKWRKNSCCRRSLRLP